MATERVHGPLVFNPSSEGTDSERERDTDSVKASIPRSVSDRLHAPLARSGSAASRSRAGTLPGSRSTSGISSSHTMHNLPSSVSPPPHTSSTHAGGILPSASFFHPSRPTFYTDFGPPGFGQNSGVLPISALSRSVGLSHATTRPESTGSESFAQTSDEAGGHITGRDRAGSAGTSNGQGPGSVSRSFSTKISREPLLPIGQKPKPVVSGLPVARNTSVRKLPGIGNTARLNEGSSAKSTEGGSGASTGGRVRTSVEKFLRKTLSGDPEVMEELEYNGSLPTTMEELQSRHRVVEEPFIEFKPTSNGKIHEDTTMDITHNGNTYRPPGIRARPPGHQYPGFDAVPPIDDPPLSRKPIVDSSGKQVHKYTLYPSKNTFFFNGKILTGGDSPWPFICTLIVLLGVSGTWLGTTAVWWWKNESPAVTIIGAYLCLLTLASMLATAFSDPGILPRNLDPDPPYPNMTSTESVHGNMPLPRELKVRSGVVRVKYCATCRIYRPPRSSHCRLCDNCVDGCDHHCQWVNNCVGRRNYTTFILLLTSATVSQCLIICTAALHLVIQAHREHLSAGEAVRRGAGSAVVFVMSAIVIWPVTGLLGYHMRLLLLNLTTIEQIRHSAHKSFGNGPPPPNPFALGNWRHNLADMLCRTQGMSWLGAGEVATEDVREPNPGSEIR